VWLARALPEVAAVGLAHLVARIASRLSRYRGIALENVGRALGNEIPEEQLTGIVRAAFLNVCLSGIELARISWLPPGRFDDRIEISGLERYREATAGGKGSIIFTAHLGNWEACGSWVTRHVQEKLAVLVRLQPNPFASELLVRVRHRLGLTVIPKQAPGSAVRGFLDDGYAVVFLADQYGGRAGVPVKLFGAETRAPKGPAVYALRTGAPLIPAFTVRLPGRLFSHRIHVEPPLEVERTGDVAHDVQVNTQRLVDVLESYVRQYPEQWLWMHRRWR